MRYGELPKWLREIARKRFAENYVGDKTFVDFVMTTNGALDTLFNWDKTLERKGFWSALDSISKEDYYKNLTFYEVEKAKDPNSVGNMFYDEEAYKRRFNVGQHEDPLVETFLNNFQ